MQQQARGGAAQITTTRKQPRKGRMRPRRLALYRRTPTTTKMLRSSAVASSSSSSSRIRTRITDLFKCRYPLVLPGMSWISTPQLVAAVSNAGGLGILATGPLSPAETRKSIRKVSAGAVGGGGGTVDSAMICTNDSAIL